MKWNIEWCNRKAKERLPYLLMAGVAFIFVLVMWWIFGMRLPEGMSGDNQARGTFGDQFGAVNALFSGLAFAGVILAIWMQSRELALQRQQLKLTYREMKNQRAEMEASVAAQHISGFINSSSALLTALESQIVDERSRYAAKQEAIDRVLAEYKIRPYGDGNGDIVFEDESSPSSTHKVAVQKHLKSMVFNRNRQGHVIESLEGHKTTIHQTLRKYAKWYPERISAALDGNYNELDKVCREQDENHTDDNI